MIREMLDLPKKLALGAAALFLPITGVAAGASTFIYHASIANLTLTVSAVASTGDLSFRLSAPAEYDWVAVGIGERMKGALTFVTYPTKNGSSVVLSPRLATGHTEPAYNPNIQASKTFNSSDPSANFINAADGGQMEITFSCRNCTKWSNPPLDLSSTTAPFMFAVGPISDGTNNRWYNEPDAPLRRHSLFGTFTMDMQQASAGNTELDLTPPLGNVTSGASSTPQVKSEAHDYGSAFHAITMCLAFGFFLPLDALLWRLFFKVKLHIIMQVMFSLLVVTGLGLGIYISTEFIRSKKAASGHQILGIVIICILLIQATIGLLHHRASRSQRSPKSARVMRFSHVFLALITFLLAVIDAGTGFKLALSSGFNKLWAPLVIAVVIVYVIVLGATLLFKGKRDKNKQPIAQFGHDYTPNQYAPGQPVVGHYGNVMNQPGAWPHGQHGVELKNMPPR